MEGELITEESIHKKGRRRKKQLYNSILNQMEFYFSSSNLTKDRFLSNLIKEDPFIDISIFLSFNKIRKLTLNIDDIRKAISKSEIIELSEDKTKVRRKLPITINENVDNCTIYVERLKSDVTHDWLTSIFSEFGKVTYVSIPRYKHNNVVKGFAFVEFENEESVKATLQYFESIDCKISPFIEPDNLCSIATFEGDQMNKQHNECSDKAESIKEEIVNMETENKNGQKRKAESSEAVAEIQQKPKKVKVNDGTEELETTPYTEMEEKKKKKTENLQRKKIKEMGLMILSKNEWKKMRNKYLNMQRKMMKELKQHLNVHKSSNWKENKQSKCQETKKASDFISGTVVEVQLFEVCADNKKLKEELKTTFKNIKFIDIPLPASSEKIYIRFEEPKDAELFCKSDFKGKPRILSGDEENNYWEKIKSNRSAKQERLSVKHRGRDKLLKKAERQVAKHIHFDDED